MTTEPNNSISQALNNDALATSQAITEVLSTTNDKDYFKIAASNLSSEAILSFKFETAEGFTAFADAFTISVVDQSGTELDIVGQDNGSVSTKQDVDFSVVVTPSLLNKPLFVKVDGTNESVNSSYKISYQKTAISEKSQDDIVSSNDSIANSQSLVPGAPFYGELDRATDIDVFSFTTGETGTVTLEFSAFSTEQLNSFYKVGLYESVDGSYVALSSGGQTTTAVPNGSTSISTITYNIPNTSGTDAAVLYAVVQANDTSVFDASVVADQPYTLTVSGTTEFNEEPVITIGDVTSGITSSPIVNSGISKTVLASSSGSEVTSDLTSLFSVSDPNEDDIYGYWVALSYAGDADNGGTLRYTDTNGASQTISAVAGVSGATGYTLLTKSEMNTAVYVSPEIKGSQSLALVAYDDSPATSAGFDDTGNPIYLSGQSGAISLGLVTSGASISASITSSTDNQLVEGSSEAADVAVVTLSLTEDSLDRTDEIIVSFNPGSDLTVYSETGSDPLESISFLEDELTKTIRVEALTDNTPEAEENTSLSFSVTSSDAAHNNLLIGDLDFVITEPILELTAGDVTFEDWTDGVPVASSQTSLDEGATNIRALYTLELSSSPANAITITPQSSDVTFLPVNATIAANATENDLSVTFRAIVTDDDLLESDPESVIITHTVTEENVVASAISPPQINLDINDNDAVIEGLTVPLLSSGNPIDSGTELKFITTDPDPIVVTVSGSSGEVSLTDAISFSDVQPSDSASYDSSNITLTDAILVLEKIVNISSLAGASAAAADVNDDGNITLTDAIMILEDIVNISSIETFDLVDSSGVSLSSLSLDGDYSLGLTLVQDGDVNLSGDFIGIT